MVSVCEGERASRRLSSRRFGGSGGIGFCGFVGDGWLETGGISCSTYVVGVAELSVRRYLIRLRGRGRGRDGGTLRCYG